MRLITRRQQDYLRYWSETGFDPSKRKACMKAAGYAPSISPTMVEKSEVVRYKIRKAMEANNLTPMRVAQKLDEKLECVDPNGNPDNKNQLKAIDLTCKLGDYYPSQKVDISKREESFRIDIKTIRLAEEVSGEKILDAEVVEEPEVAALGAGPDDSL